MKTFTDCRLELAFVQALQRYEDAAWMAMRAFAKEDYINAYFFAGKSDEWQSLAIGLASR